MTSSSPLRRTSRRRILEHRRDAALAKRLDDTQVDEDNSTVSTSSDSSFPEPTGVFLPDFTSSVPAQNATQIIPSTSQTSSPSLTATLTPGPTQGSTTRTSSTLADMTSSSSSISTSSPFPTETSFTIESSSSSSGLQIGAIVGIVLGVLTLIALSILCFVFRRRSRRKRQKQLEKGERARPFGTDSKEDLIVNSVPNAAGIMPFTLKTDRYLEPPNRVRIPAKLAMLSDSYSSPSSSSPSGLTPNSAVEQQTLLEELNALKARLAEVEAIAYINGSNSSDNSEPPPQYQAGGHSPPKDSKRRRDSQ